MTKEILTEFEVGERLDKAVAVAYPEYSRSALEKLIESGDILVNNQPAKAKYKLKESDKISIDFTSLNAPIKNIELPIIYEDDTVVVINKPTGVLTHSKGAFNDEPTVASFVLPKLTGTKEWKSTNRAGIVHRLDRATSGVIICAKNKLTQDYLQGQFSKRNVKKSYLAIIAGELPESEGLIDVPIERNPKKPATFRAGANGKSAQTYFKVLQSDGSYSLVELSPKTGRTHQLRVHLAYLKHPIVGDTFYGGKVANRLMLHAWKLEITLPNSERKIFEAPIPKAFTEPL